jgi:hypothetical protein
MEAQALVAELQVSPAFLVRYSLRRLALGCTKPSFLINPNKIQTPAPKNPQVKSILRALHLRAAHPDNPSDQLTSCNQNYPL